MKTVFRIMCFVVIVAIGKCTLCDKAFAQSLGPPMPADCMKIVSAGNLLYAFRRDKRYDLSLDIQVSSAGEKWSSIETDFYGDSKIGFVSSVVKVDGATLLGIRCRGKESVYVCRIGDDRSFELLPVIELEDWTWGVVRLISTNGNVTVVLRQNYMGNDFRSPRTWQGDAHAWTWRKSKNQWEKRTAGFKDIVRGPNGSETYLTWSKSTIRASVNPTANLQGSPYKVAIPAKTKIIGVCECHWPRMLLECEREYRICFLVADFSTNEMRVREITFPKSVGELYDPHLRPSGRIAAAFTKVLDPGYAIDRVEISLNRSGDYGRIHVKERFSDRSDVRAEDIRVVPTSKGAFVYWRLTSDGAF